MSNDQHPAFFPFPLDTWAKRRNTPAKHPESVSLRLQSTIAPPHPLPVRHHGRPPKPGMNFVAELLPLRQGEPVAATDLWYRKNDMCPAYLPVESTAHALTLLRGIHPDDPWVTFVSGPPTGNSVYFQVLGTPDRLVAEGGLQYNGFERCWRASALPINTTSATVGPSWYELPVWESDVLTNHDAETLMWPALAHRSQHFSGVPGIEAIWWDDVRTLDSHWHSS